jgi:hypothetical protein
VKERTVVPPLPGPGAVDHPAILRLNRVNRDSEVVQAISDVAQALASGRCTRRSVTPAARTEAQNIRDVPLTGAQIGASGWSLPVDGSVPLPDRNRPGQSNPSG